MVDKINSIVYMNSKMEINTHPSPLQGGDSVLLSLVVLVSGHFDTSVFRLFSGVELEKKTETQ